MKKIDIATWNRREIYEFFSGVSNPFYMMSFTVDVTELRYYCKEHGLSFYLSLIYLCTKALDSVENFRYTLRNGEIYLLDGRRPSFTDMGADGELFHITNAEMTDSLESFVKSAGEKSKSQTCFIDYRDESDALVYYSCSPKLRLTALTNERDLINPKSAESNIPSLAWGMYTDNGGRLELNVCMEVNHRFIDGIHITRFAAELDRLIKSL